LALCGCASERPIAGTQRPFNFQTDTFSYANELVWDYYYDAKGKWVSQPHLPKPDYTHHCFVVARSAKQFFDQARFDPSQPVADAATYRRLIRSVVSSAASRVRAEADRIVIPGYANLREFSAAQEPLLKAECGGAWQSYVQHGHWRIMAPFTRHHQEKMAAQLLQELKTNLPVVAHLVRFPHMTINHAVVLYAAAENDQEIRFTTYDPNRAAAPVMLVYDRARRTFEFAANDYFEGGRVDVYEVYRDWRY
jgi:hypothetical protein